MTRSHSLQALMALQSLTPSWVAVRSATPTYTQKNTHQQRRWIILMIRSKLRCNGLRNHVSKRSMGEEVVRGKEKGDSTFICIACDFCCKIATLFFKSRYSMAVGFFSPLEDSRSFINCCNDSCIFLCGCQLTIQCSENTVASVLHGIIYSMQ